VSDYRQPDFFRIGHDQLFLVRHAAALTRHRSCETLIDLGAGSGVLACELTRLIAVDHAHLVEVQEAEWAPFLAANLSEFARLRAHTIHWRSVGEFNRDGELRAQLLVANPPYFLPSAGRPSPDQRRNIAHRFVVDSWQAWVDAMVRSLAPDGEAFWLQRDPGPQGRPVLPAGWQWSHVVREGRLRVIRLAREA